MITPTRTRTTQEEPTQYAFRRISRYYTTIRRLLPRRPRAIRLDRILLHIRQPLHRLWMLLRCVARGVSGEVKERRPQGRTGCAHVPPLGELDILLDTDADFCIVCRGGQHRPMERIEEGGLTPNGKFRLGKALHRALLGPQIRLAVILLQHALGARQEPPTERQLGLGIGLFGRSTEPGDAPLRIARASEVAVFVRRAELELRWRVPKLRRLGVELARERVVFRDQLGAGAAEEGRGFVQHGEFVKRVRVLGVGLLGSATEPGDPLARVPGLLE